MSRSLVNLLVGVLSGRAVRRCNARLVIEQLEGRLCLSKLFVSSDTTDAVYRYDVQPDQDPTLELTITDPSLDRPGGLAFSPANELFVNNRGPNISGPGSVSRFLDPGENPISNGMITFGINYPHFSVFVGNELFIVNTNGNNVLRFIIEPDGTARPNGAITAGIRDGAARGITVGPGNELFVTQLGVNTINRYLLDEQGNAIPNGVITDDGLTHPHDLVFSSWGELFVADPGNTYSIRRFVFDEQGNAVPNGQITGIALNGPIGLSFSPWDELFVSNVFGDGGISRWTFDDSYNAIFNGLISTPTPVGDLRFMPEAPLPAGFTHTFGQVRSSGGNCVFTATHTFATAGSYTATVTITDTHPGGMTATATSTIDVTDPGGMPSPPPSRRPAPLPEAVAALLPLSAPVRGPVLLLPDMGSRDNLVAPADTTALPTVTPLAVQAFLPGAEAVAAALLHCSGSEELWSWVSNQEPRDPMAIVSL